MKLLLTSTGFDNPNILAAFHKLLGRPPQGAKALFLPTALNSPEAREYVHVFVEDLLKAGVPEENIITYDLDRPMGEAEISGYDIVFACPGEPEFLLSRMNAVGFAVTLKSFFDSGGVYVGVSAGSDVVADNFADNLGYLAVRLETHAKEGSPNGPVDMVSADTIKITDNQAVIIDGSEISVIE
jgi:peptidase E